MDKAYFKKYYRENIKKYKPGISVRQLAIVKRVSRVTVYNNAHLFDKIETCKSLRFHINDKILNWYPNETGPKNYGTTNIQSKNERR